MTKRSLLAVLTTAAGITAGALSLADAQTTTGAPAGAGSANQPDPRTSFAVFRRGANPGDEMPPEARRELATVAGREQLDLDAARAVAPSGAGYVWAIPGAGSVCLAIPDPVDGFGINCASATDAQQGELWVGLDGLPGQEAGDARIAVLVPDGIDAVTAVDGQGNGRALPVSDNVAFADVQDSARVEYTDGDGTHSDDVPGTPPALVSGG